MRVAIVQPAFFPWIGTLQKIRSVDLFIHYDDVLLSRGDYTNRAKIKSSRGVRWLTVPLHNFHLGKLIREVEVDPSQAWGLRHLQVLREEYRRAPFKEEMLAIVSDIYAKEWSHIGDLSISTIEVACQYFGIRPPCGFVRASQLDVSGSGTERLLKILQSVGGTTYVCGAGKQRVSARYLDHEMLERAEIRIEYMQYSNIPYLQQHGDFLPGLSVLDLIANEGMRGHSLVSGFSRYWKELVAEESS